LSVTIPKLRKVHQNESPFVLDCPEMSLSGTGFTCIIGKNGSGKSTYGAALAELRAGQADSWYYLPQHLDRFLFGENVLEQLGTLLSQEIDRERLINLIQELGFTHAESMLNFPFLLMSGGERRRMALVCVFYLNPSQVILDEPEIGVTPKENMVLLSKLHNLTAKHASIIVISHTHEFVRESSDLICLVEGKIDRVGQTEELLSDPAFELKNYGVRFR